MLPLDSQKEDRKKYEKMLDTLREKFFQGENENFQKHDLKQLKRHYDAQLRRYKQIHTIVKELESQREKTGKKVNDAITYYDSLRHTIHQELFLLAKKLKKNQGDVYLDILLGEENLNEVGLPEFRFSKISKILQSGKNTHVMSWSSESDKGKEFFVDTEQYVVPFVEQEGWHLFDNQEYFDVLPGDREKVRRMKKFSELCGGTIVQINLASTFHRVVKVLGVVLVNSQKAAGLKTLMEYKEDISIDESFFDKEQIEDDWRDILSDSIQEVCNYHCNERENVLYLLKRLKEHIELVLDIPQKLRDIGISMVERAIEDEKAREIRKEVDSQLNQEFEVDTFHSSARYESMRRQRNR